MCLTIYVNNNNNNNSNNNNHNNNDDDDNGISYLPGKLNNVFSMKYLELSICKISLFYYIVVNNNL